MKKLFKRPDISLLALKVWQRNRDSYKRYYKANLFGSLGEPLLYLFGMGVGLSFYMPSIQGVSYVQFIAPGLIISASMYAASFECTFGSYTRMTQQRTFDAILSTPLSIGDIVLGEILWGASKSLIGGTTMLLVIILAGLMKGTLWCIIPVIILIFVVGVLFSALAITVTAISPSYDFFSYYFTLVLAPMFFFSGIFFPLDKFPDSISLFSDLLPLTHAVKISRTILLGSFSIKAVLIGLPFLITLAILFTLIAINLIKDRLVK